MNERLLREPSCGAHAALPRFWARLEQSGENRLQLCPDRLNDNSLKRLQMQPFGKIPELTKKVMELIVEEHFSPPVFVMMVSKNYAMQIEKFIGTKEGTCLDTEFSRWSESEDRGVQFPIRIVVFDETGNATAAEISLSDLIDYNPN
jgi:hypothetical protein